MSSIYQKNITSSWANGTNYGTIWWGKGVSRREKLLAKIRNNPNSKAVKSVLNALDELLEDQ